ncbi:MAG TPA: hypothetical protein DEF47_08640 [Herpetosiphon sp.]|uniref:hypothetical protein n=1 Tax=Herpetosiphon sp. TaxID=71864 RepID=UPI00059E5AAD|nr:hypothetical protein [Herpetosiphon sp.]HBW49960.1 hypothetical protein [Herpetosiphon sp.]
MIHQHTQPAPRRGTLTALCWWVCGWVFVLQLALICPLACILHESIIQSLPIDPFPAIAVGQFVCIVNATPPASGDATTPALTTMTQHHGFVALFAMAAVGWAWSFYRAETLIVFRQICSHLRSHPIPPILPPPRLL